MNISFVSPGLTHIWRNYCFRMVLDEPQDKMQTLITVCQSVCAQRASVRPQIATKTILQIVIINREVKISLLQEKK